MWKTVMALMKSCQTTQFKYWNTLAETEASVLISCSRNKLLWVLQQQLKREIVIATPHQRLIFHCETDTAKDSCCESDDFLATSEENLRSPNTSLSQTSNQGRAQMSHLMTKPTKWLCAQRRLRSAGTSAQSDQSLHCPHEERLDP